MRPALWRSLGLALMLGVLARAPAWAQKPAPADTRELVAVLELDGVGASKAQLAALSEELRAQLLNSGKFRVVDRQQIDAVLNEQALQQTGCTSQECAIQVGKILGVRKMIVGRVTKIEEGLWQLSAQMVDAESAETVRAVTYMHEGKFSTLVDPGMSVLAAKLTGTAVAPAAVASAKPAAEPVASATLAAGQTWRDAITGMEFVWVPGGSFEMGCGSWNRNCYEDEKPTHQVTVGGFWLGKTEVTQGQWTLIVGNNPSRFKNGDTYPVESVSWTDAQEFVSRLNSQSGGVKFRLPTEAEWEYACRGGGKAQVYGTQSGELSTGAAKYGGSYKGSTTPVASYPPNALGLYDMTGNVWELVQDAYAPYSGAAATNPVNNAGASRVRRGGGWLSSARYTRCSDRYSLDPGLRDDDLGLRLLRSP